MWTKTQSALIGVRRAPAFHAKTRETLVLIHHRLCHFLTAGQKNFRGMQEAGGILIGNFRGPHVEILDWTVPGPEDQRTFSSFVKQDASHQEAATAAWVSSSSTNTYVGEWHSHPYGGPLPSTVDKVTWKSVSTRLKTPCVFIIVAPAGWGVFLLNGRQSPAVVKLSRVEQGETGVVFG